MTRKHRIVIEGAIVAIAFLAVFLISFSAYADVSATRERESSGRTTTPPPPPPPPSPAPAPVPPPSNPSGGITNVTTGEVDSGSNTGGKVTTGDESVDVTVVNIGPVNNTQSVIVPSPTPSPTPSCDPRTRIGCGTQGPDRTR